MNILQVQEPNLIKNSVKPNDVYLTKKELCQRFKFSETTLYRRLKENDFPKPIRYSQSCLRWSIKEIEAWEAKKSFERV